MHILSFIWEQIYFTMQTSTLLQRWMLKKKLESLGKIPTHPCIAGKKEFEGLAFEKRKFKLWEKFLKIKLFLDHPLVIWKPLPNHSYYSKNAAEEENRLTKNQHRRDKTYVKKTGSKLCYNEMSLCLSLTYFVKPGHRKVACTSWPSDKWGENVASIITSRW